MVRLVRALYGHPDSGTFWEKHCHNRFLSVGFQPIQSWPSCYTQAKLGLTLSVYVDDFKMAGPQKHLKEGCRLIRDVAKLDLEPPSDSLKQQDNLYLGCTHERSVR